MSITKQLKILLSDSYEVESDLSQLIEQCFQEIFKEKAPLAFSLFEEDLQKGREYNGFLQSIDYYKKHIG